MTKQSRRPSIVLPEHSASLPNTSGLGAGGNRPFCDGHHIAAKPPGYAAKACQRRWLFVGMKKCHAILPRTGHAAKLG